MKLDPAEADRFIVTHTALSTPPLVPEIRLYLATEITPIWQATEAMLEESGVAPPFWAFAWAGGQALARHILDHPEYVAGKSVLDFGAGSGLLSIAARLAGAAGVCAADIDPLACAAIRLNARENRVEVATTMEDVIDSASTVDTVLVGDMCYERPLAERLIRWLRGLAAQGVEVLLGDPGRTYKPTSGLTEIARYMVPTSLELEDREQRDGVVWRVLPWG